jgi:hypothetical protein
MGEVQKLKNPKSHVVTTTTTTTTTTTAAATANNNNNNRPVKCKRVGWTRLREMRSACQILSGKPGGRLTHSW